MLVVVDTNRIYSSLISKGKSFKVFRLNSLLKKFEFISPEFMFSEIGKNLDEIVIRSKLTKEELAKVFSFIKEQIDPVPFKDFNKYAAEADKVCPHAKDIQYFALSLAFNRCPIWSSENKLSKQTNIEIFDTDKMLSLLEEDSEEAEDEREAGNKSE